MSEKQERGARRRAEKGGRALLRCSEERPSWADEKNDEKGENVQEGEPEVGSSVSFCAPGRPLPGLPAPPSPRE